MSNVKPTYINPTGGYSQPVNTATDSISANAVYVQTSATPDTSVGISRDVSNNLVLTDTVTGTKTLAQIATGGTVTNVTGTSPISVANGSTTPSITLNTVPVNKGGTGATSFTANELLVGNGTSAVGTAAGLTFSSGKLGISGVGNIFELSDSIDGTWLTTNTTFQTVELTDPLGGGTSMTISGVNGVVVVNTENKAVVTSAPTTSHITGFYPDGTATYPELKAEFSTDGITFNPDTLHINAAAIDVGGYVLPTTDGTAGQVLTTNGAGTVTWAAGGGGGSTVTFAQQFYVAKNGNDGTGDGSLSKPYLTIGAALTAAGAVADTEYVRINVSPGTYTENLTITRRRTVLWGSGSAPQTPVTTVAGTVTINPATANDRFNDLIAFYGLVLTSLAGSTSAAVGCTGTQLYAVVITSCYVATANAGYAALSCDNSNASRCTITLRQTTVARTVGTGTANVCDFTRGDVRFDTVLVQSSATGTYRGVNLTNNASLISENSQIDTSGTGAALFASGAISGVKVIWTGGAIYSRSNASGAPALYLSNTSGVGALLSSTSLMTEYTGAGLVTIDGVFTSPFPTFYFTNLTFLPNSSSVTNSTVAAALAAVAQRLTTYGILPATNGGTGQSSYTTGDLLYASSATALSKLAAGTAGTALLSAGPGAAPAWGPLPYSAANPAQWATSAPTTVKAALDRLASAVYALRGNVAIP